FAHAKITVLPDQYESLQIRESSFLVANLLHTSHFYAVYTKIANHLTGQLIKPLTSKGVTLYGIGKMDRIDPVQLLIQKGSKSHLGFLDGCHSFMVDKISE